MPVVPFITLLLAPSKPKLVDCKSRTIVCIFLEFVILVNCEAKWSKFQDALRTDFGVNNRSISVYKDIKRSVKNMATAKLSFFYVTMGR